MAEKQNFLFGAGAYGDAVVTPQMLAAANDPDTSHIAAARMVESGTLSRHAEAVLGAIRRHPRSTYPELFKLAKEDGDTVLPNEAALQRRLSDLKKAGLIRCVLDDEGAYFMRECTVHNGQMMTVFEATTKDA